MIWYCFNFVFHYKCLTWELEGGSFGFSRHDIVGRLVFCTSLQCVNCKPIPHVARRGRPENCFYTSKFKRGSPLKTRPTEKLLHEGGGTLVSHLHPGDVAVGLRVDPVQGLVLPVQGRVHVVRHVPDVADHGAHLILNKIFIVIRFCEWKRMRKSVNLCKVCSDK